ncbi:MAG: PKD domain-containing protein, partial [Candidatus Magasanikbacteria bacterium]|nr:PKD domain-containing protein [Candidatus Magasanikbacteria bacterium]
FSDGWRIEPFGQCTNEYAFSRPFAMTYFHFGGLSELGHPANEVHRATSYEYPGYDALAGIALPWIQDVTNTCGGNAWLTLAMNPLVMNLRMGSGNSVLGVVFPVHGRIRDYWRVNFSLYGYPACNEYDVIINNKKYIVQWFQKGYGDYRKITYDTYDGTFNDPETNSVVYGEHLKQSVWENLGCPKGICGTGGAGIQPNDPINLATTAVSETQIDLIWNGNNGDNPVVYRVYRKLSNESGESIYIGSTSSTNFSDSFLNPGTSYCYQVSASYEGLESAKSQEASTTTPIFTNLNLPTADFSVDRNVIYTGKVIFFTDRSTGTQISSWYWDFGDGYTSTLQSPSHRFNYSGHYDISLTVTNMYGSRTVIKRDSIYVLAGFPESVWGTTDVGNSTARGYASYDNTNDRYIIDGTGLGIDESHSQFTYLHQPYNGCINFSTRILSQTLSGPKAMSGIMFMETDSSTSSYVMIAVTQGQGVIFQYKQNGIVTKIGGDYYDFPIYLKLTRNGSKFVGYYSFTNNPSDWNQIGSLNMNFAEDYQVGIFATPANSTGVSTAIFDSLTISDKPDKPRNPRIQ